MNKIIILGLVILSGLVWDISVPQVYACDTSSPYKQKIGNCNLSSCGSGGVYESYVEYSYDSQFNISCTQLEYFSSSICTLGSQVSNPCPATCSSDAECGEGTCAGGTVSSVDVCVNGNRGSDPKWCQGFNCGYKCMNDYSCQLQSPGSGFGAYGYLSDCDYYCNAPTPIPPTPTTAPGFPTSTPNPTPTNPPGPVPTSPPPAGSWMGNCTTDPNGKAAFAVSGSTAFSYAKYSDGSYAWQENVPFQPSGYHLVTSGQTFSWHVIDTGNIDRLVGSTACFDSASPPPPPPPPLPTWSGSGQCLTSGSTSYFYINPNGSFAGSSYEAIGKYADNNSYAFQIWLPMSTYQQQVAANRPFNWWVQWSDTSGQHQTPVQQTTCDVPTTSCYVCDSCAYRGPYQGFGVSCPAGDCDPTKPQEMCFSRANLSGARCDTLNAACQPSPTPSPTPLPQPPSTPTVSVTECISPGYSGSGVNISWTNNNYPVTWVDISGPNDSNFSTAYHRGVSTSANQPASTTGPFFFYGYLGTSAALTLTPGATYYVRLYNGSPINGGHSQVVSFQASPSCTGSTPTPTPPATCNYPASGGGGGGGGGGAAYSWTFDSNTNLNHTATGSRSCADAISYQVINLANTATNTVAHLNTTPQPGCLATGDEVLLINLQGTPSSYANVGNYEILTVRGVSSYDVTLTKKQKFYGDGNSDGNIGTGSTSQKVMLQRVPTYLDLTISPGVTLTADGWNGWYDYDSWFIGVYPGTKGGVLALKVAGTLTIGSGGRIDMNGRGYNGGRKLRGSPAWENGPDSNFGQCNNWYTIVTCDRGTDCHCGAVGFQGVSYAGTPYQGHSNQDGSRVTPFFGGGAAGPSTGSTCFAWNDDDKCTNSVDFGAGSGGGYGTEGGDSISGCNDSGCSALNGGEDYGSASLNTLFLGSGGGSGGSYGGGNGGNSSGFGGAGGGIIYIQATKIVNNGTISAAGQNGGDSYGRRYSSWYSKASAGGGGAGGSILLASANFSPLGLTSVTGGTGGTRDGKDRGGSGGDGWGSQGSATIVTAPTVTPNLSCITPGYYKPGAVTVSWTNPGVQYIDISVNDSSFLSFYNKKVTGLTRTTGPDGFKLFGSSFNQLMFNPNTTYYARTFDCLNFSPYTSFTIPSCTTPSTTPRPTRSPWTQTNDGDVHVNE